VASALAFRDRNRRTVTSAALSAIRVGLHPVGQGRGHDHAGLVSGRPVLECEVAVVAPSLAVVDQSDAGKEAMVPPRVTHRAQPSLAIEAAQRARGVPPRLDAVEDLLTPA
jgi:hypothetical protein